MRFQEIQEQAMKGALHGVDTEERGFDSWLVGVESIVKKYFPFLVTNGRLFTQQNFIQYPYWYTHWEQKLSPAEAAAQWMDDAQIIPGDSTRANMTIRDVTEAPIDMGASEETGDKGLGKGKGKGLGKIINSIRTKNRKERRRSDKFHVWLREINSILKVDHINFKDLVSAYPSDYLVDGFARDISPTVAALAGIDFHNKRVDRINALRFSG